MDWEKIVSFLIDTAASLGVRLLAAGVILAIGLKLVSLLKRFLKRSARLSRIDESVRSFLASVVAIVLDVLLFLTVASILGVPVTSFLTLLASCGVAIGLALQGALSNFAGGLMILLFRPFRVGDFVEATGESGTVVEISVVYTVLLTIENKRITIPNGTLMSSVVKNYTAEKTRRVDLVFSTAYETPIDLTYRVLLEVAGQHELVLKDPAPFVRLSAHGDNALEYTVRVWCKTEDYWTVYFDVIEAAKRAFDENDIRIPYPQMDVHVDRSAREDA